ncbi:hypothetical protein BC567DRAFT_209019 [Phyllosticta citribraziliensis]
MDSLRVSLGLLMALLFSGLVGGLATQQQQQQSNAPSALQMDAHHVHTPAVGPWAAANTPKMGEVPVGTPFPIKISYPLHPVPTARTSSRSSNSTTSTTSTPADADITVLALSPSKMSSVTFISERTILSPAVATFTLVVDKTTTVTRDGKTKAKITPSKITITEPYTATLYQKLTVTSIKKHTTTAVADHTITQVYDRTTTAPIGSMHSAISSAGDYTRTLTLASTIEVSPSPVLSSSTAASSTASNSDHHVNAGLIVGICLGVSCFFVVLIAFFWFLVRRRRRNQLVKDHELDTATWTGAAMTLVSSRDSKLGEKADGTSTNAQAHHESAPNPNPGPRTVDDLHSASTPRRHSMPAQPSYRKPLPTPLELKDDDEENPFLSDEERAARSPIKSAAAVPRPTSLPPAQPAVVVNDEEEQARKALARQMSVELRRTATFANMMEQQERELQKAREWLDRMEREREERKLRERPMSLCSSLDE